MKPGVRCYLDGLVAIIGIDIPEDFLAITGKTSEEFAEDARFLLAAKMFELGRMSSGQAARLAGMHRVDFLLALGTVGVSMIQTDVHDLRDELARG